MGSADHPDLARAPNPYQWNPRRAAELAREALEGVGIADARTSLIKFRAAFATLRVESPALLVKLAAPDARDALGRSLQLGELLAEAGVPVAAPAVELASGPIPVSERFAGIWRWVDRSAGRPDPVTTGQSLRRLHETLVGSELDIPRLDPIVTSRQRLAQVRESEVLPIASVAFLDARLQELSDAWEDFETELRVGPIHGDFKIANLMTTADGPLIMDLDDVRVAPWEWDLATISRRAHDGWLAAEWPEFCSGYGHDLLAQPTAGPLRELTHLGALIFQLARHQTPERLERGRALLDEWLRQPSLACYELDWDGVFGRIPDRPTRRS